LANSIPPFFKTELVASFAGLSKLLKLWKKTETHAARKSTAHGLENVPISASLFHALARSPTHFSPRTARGGCCGLLPEPRRAGSVLQKTRNQLYCRNRRILLIPSNGNGSRLRMISISVVVNGWNNVAPGLFTALISSSTGSEVAVSWTCVSPYP
jgi:hypothetical protein